VEVLVPTSNGGDWSNDQFKLLVDKGDTKEEYKAMINNRVNASKALRTYIGTCDGSSMKDFDNMKSLLNEEAESTPGMCVWIDSFLIIIFACNNTVFYPWLLAEMEQKRKHQYKESLKKFTKDTRARKVKRVTRSTKDDRKVERNLC
jgi:hypothetical protein